MPHTVTSVHITCVSSMHSRKSITLLKLMTELMYFLKFLENLFLDTFFLKEFKTDITPKPLELFD